MKAGVKFKFETLVCLRGVTRFLRLGLSHAFHFETVQQSEKSRNSPVYGKVEKASPPSVGFQLGEDST